jgi:hypothetical protein
MNDRVRAFGETAKRRIVGERTLDRRKILGTRLQSACAARERSYRVTLRQKAFDHDRSEEPGSAGDRVG